MSWLFGSGFEVDWTIDYKMAARDSHQYTNQLAEMLNLPGHTSNISLQM